MRCGVFLFLCACDRVLGIMTTVPADAVDARFFDGPESFVCPSLGTTPSYSSFLHQVVTEECSEYSVSAARSIAIAECQPDPLQGQFISTGPIDAMLTTAVGFETDPAYAVMSVQLSATGTAFVTYEHVTMPFLVEYRTYDVQPDGSWLRGIDAFASTLNTGALLVAPPTTGSPRHRIYGSNTDQSLHEQVEASAGMWIDVGTILPSDLGIAYPSRFRLSADGLRMTLTAPASNGQVGVPMFTDRLSIDAPFRRADTLVDRGVPAVATDFFMTEDCSRVYITGLGAIFYLQEL